MSPATTEQRVGAALLDVLFSLPLCLIWLVPIIGTLVGGFGLLLYWLLRDLAAPSFGKRIVGLRVVDLAGNPAETKALILRNITLAGPCLIVMIPFISFSGAGIEFVMSIVELVLLATGGARLGDKIADTRVVKA